LPIAAPGAGSEVAAAATPGLTAEAAWARATPAAAKVGVVYLTLVDSGRTSDRLISLSTPAAGRAEMHIEIDEGGVTQMRAVSAVDIKAGERIAFRPNGLHIMLIDLVHPLRRGEHLPLSLIFEKAGRVDTDVLVLSAGALSYP
jgi:periplasmic copper chaperone A